MQSESIFENKYFRILGGAVPDGGGEANPDIGGLPHSH